jgi:beta-glucanase (GH16 family)
VIVIPCSMKGKSPAHKADFSNKHADVKNVFDVLVIENIPIKIKPSLLKRRFAVQNKLFYFSQSVFIQGRIIVLLSYTSIKSKRTICLLVVLFISGVMSAQSADPYKPDSGAPKQINGMKLVWNDEFNNTGKPDSTNWRYERGFVRNEELQWYQPDNANCAGGMLIIEGRREKVKNPRYKDGSQDWKGKREYAEYTSASMQTRGLREWLYGRFEIRARIDTAKGAWPAIWTLGKGGWPECGEVDIMEFYRRDVPIVLANVAWGTEKRWKAKWNEKTVPLSGFLKSDSGWVKKFHLWRMDWDSQSIKLYLDDVLINSQPLSETINADGTSPFTKPMYLLLNLALGSNGDDPANSRFPIKYEVDYMRVYQSN